MKNWQFFMLIWLIYIGPLTYAGDDNIGDEEVLLPF